MTILMGLYTNRAYAIAPGLGLNAVVAFGLVAARGCRSPRDGPDRRRGHRGHDPGAHRDAREDHGRDPARLKKAIAIGIGLFIAFIGLVNSGIVVKGTPAVDLARLTTWPAFVTFFGLA
jgi:AGZA family xanthine/uracil permease-like MFS transporter